MGFAWGGNGRQRHGTKRNKRMRSIFSRYHRYLLDIAFLAVIFWVARYFLSAHFGLYEDDLTRIPDAFSMNLRDVWGHLNFLMTHYYANRPLHEGFIYVLSWLGWQVNGLWGAYWVGYLITVVNIALFYLLLVKKHSRLLGLLGGLAYALFSADTTQAYLTMSLGGQISNTLLLLAFHSYLFGPKWLSYLIVYPIILFFYETPFLVFFAAPLLDKPRNNRQFWTTVLWHGGIMTAMLLSSFLMRYFQGGNVNFELGYRETLILALAHLVEGPAVAVGTYFLRPIQILVALNPTAGIVSLLGFVVIALYLNSIKIEGDFAPGFLAGIVRGRKFSELDDDTRVLLQLAVAGLVMLLLAYPMTFTTRLTAISGRATRGHLAGVSGASLLFASFAYAIHRILSYYHQRRIATVFFAGLFALLVGFGILIQQDYVKAWQVQKDFWAELLPLIPDAGEGTAILVEPEGLEDVLQIGANTWNLSRLLNQLYIFSPEMSSVPRVYRLLPGWQGRIVTGEGFFQANQETVTAPPDNYNTFESENVILISTEHGLMTRVRGPLDINGQLYPLKPQTAPVSPNLRRGVLYQLLVDDAP
jgi:hypothetical protein